MPFPPLSASKQRLLNWRAQFLGGVPASGAALQPLQRLEPVHPVDQVVRDCLEYHQIESAKALAAGVATTYTVDIKGDVAEFGSMTGYTARSIARSVALCEASLLHAMAIYGTPPKQFDVYDSFAGLPDTDTEVDRSSPHVVDGVWLPGACKGLTEEELRAVLAEELPGERVTTHAGWFKDTLPLVPASTRYCLVHIDGDLYSSAIDVLSNLFGRRLLSPGALVFFDDWNCNRASPDFGERRAWRESVDRFDVQFSDRGGYGLFGHSFFVHHYRAQAES